MWETIATVSMWAIGGLLWMEHRLTKIDTLLSNHLAHHEVFEKLMLRGKPKQRRKLK